jgi:hypothetical protein
LDEFRKDSIENAQGVLEYEKPNENLYEFKGKLIVNNRE